MNELVTKEDIKIENMIHEIRGKEVMLDSDFALLFGYSTKDLNRNMKNNIKRFPSNYCFQITNEENENLRCKKFTSNNNYGGRRYLPYVYTEHGVTMLAGILKSDLAIEMSLRIVNTFVEMRKYINSNLLEQKYINDLVLEHESEIKYLKLSFDKLSSKVVNNHIFFEG